MKKILNYFVYIIVYGIWYLASLLPLCVLYLFSDFLYLLIAHVVKYRHKVIWKNLKNSFPEKNDTELKEIEHDFYRYFCDYLVETIKGMTMSEKQIRKRMTFSGTEQINECWEKGQSCGVYLGHLGNYEWITSLPFWVSDKGQCCQIYHPLENEYFNKISVYVRERQGALCIPMAESLRRIVEFRKKGKPIVIGYIADQVPFWNNIHHWLNFLNQDTPVLTGSERLIKKTNQAAFYADVTRVSRGHYHCEMKLITTDASQYEDWQLTDIYFNLLEKTIRRNPGIYLWSHNRWKRSHEEYNIRYNPENGRVDLRDINIIKKEKGIDC